jgi:hypothetical protein
MARQTWEKLIDMERRSRFPVRKFESLEAMKAEEYEYWQHRPDYERTTSNPEGDSLITRFSHARARLWFFNQNDALAGASWPDALLRVSSHSFP